MVCLYIPEDKRCINIDVDITQRRNDMLGSDKRVLFQTRVNSDLLRKFREVQEKQGRTARSLIEDYFYQLVDADNRKEIELEGERWQTK